MADSEKQTVFISGLRKIAEEAASKNPALRDMRTLAKTLVAETRTVVARHQTHISLGAYMGREGEVSIIEPATQDASEASAEILLTLRARAKDGNIRAAALSVVRDKQVPGGAIVRFIQVHMEHVEGKAFISAVPADESVLLAGVPGAGGPALNMFGGPTQSKIFGEH
jgi:hypothetical protein